MQNQSIQCNPSCAPLGERPIITYSRRILFRHRGRDRTTGRCFIKASWSFLKEIIPSPSQIQYIWSWITGSLFRYKIFSTFYRESIEPFNIYTDHKPLTFAFLQKSDKASPTQARQLDFIGQFSTSISHISGKSNVVADTLSRIQSKLSTTHQLWNIANSPTGRHRATTISCRLNYNFIKSQENHSTCDISQSNARPFVPKSFRKEVFDKLYNLWHLGIKATKKLISQRCVWINMNKDITVWTKCGIACQKSKIHRHIQSPFQKLEVPDTRFNFINLDLVGPLPPWKGFIYCQTIIDRYTCWTEARH